MKYLILVSHGQFAEGVKTSLEMFAGDAIEQCFALCLHIGGSPLTTFLNVFSEHSYFANTVVIGGMNFPMALTALVSLDTMPKEELIKSALSEGEKAIKQYEIPQSSFDDEDDI